MKNTTRRSFLKKVAYTAPVVIGLGALVSPTDVRAGLGGDPDKPLPSTSSINSSIEYAPIKKDTLV